MANALRKITSPNERKGLFIELASKPEGTTVSDVYRRATALGDTVSEEAYYNLARRLVHRGLVASEATDQGTLYRAGTSPDSRWLEEDDLAELVDQDYPLLALPVWKESRRLLNEVPDSVWIELRERLRAQDARSLFRDAIESYCDDLHAQIADLAATTVPKPDLARMRQAAQGARDKLQMITKFGLGLSAEAVAIPPTIDAAIAEAKAHPNDRYYDATLLEAELKLRIAPGRFIVDIPAPDPKAKQLVIAAVDGSMRGGLLSFLGEDSDVEMGHSPMVAINTSVGHLNRLVLHQGERTQVFLRLPERPEDMQREDNRYTIMAKLLFPDLSEAEYMHAVWNAMDLIEAKVALRTLRRWDTAGGLEAPAADLVLRDGAIAPQDRDFNHYKADSSYGRIVRKMIEVHWEIAKKTKDDAQTFASVVKAAQMSVFAPVVNWFASRIVQDPKSQIAGWPIHSLNLMADQPLMTRLLTAGRGKNDPWTRTCAIMRPFHATTNFAKGYSRERRPSDMIMARYADAQKDPDALEQENQIFWESFRGESDAYMQMLENVRYCGCFIGAVPRLDIEKNLPRFEVLVPAPTGEDAADPWPIAQQHLDRLVIGVEQNKFEVSAEHNMFAHRAKIDVLPRQLILAHDTVKTWAGELLSRVQEYIGAHLAKYVNTKRFRGIKVRPFSREELKLLYEQLKKDRHELAGSGQSPANIAPPPAMVLDEGELDDDGET